MTPTEQDKELTKAIYEAMQVPYLSERHDAIKKLIIADRKRVALEARINEIGIMQHQARVNLKTSNAVAEWGDIRIAQLKAQQEEA